MCKEHEEEFEETYWNAVSEIANKLSPTSKDSAINWCYGFISGLYTADVIRWEDVLDLRKIVRCKETSIRREINETCTR